MDAGIDHILANVRSCEGSPEAIAATGTLRVDRLQGDASSRAYYRLSSGGSSAILMRLPAGAIPVEEGFVGKQKTPAPDSYPFIPLQSLLHRAGIPVMGIYAYDLGCRYLLLEDLGDVQLFTLAKDSSQSHHVEALYRQALDVLVDMQGLQRNTGFSESIASQRSFNKELYEWEFEHFIEYGLRQHACFDTDEPKAPKLDVAVCRRLFAAAAEELAQLPKVFTHRDYHSKNIMVKDGGIAIIDFQDALLGPLAYDVVSLLRDSYILLPQHTFDNLLAYYYERAKAADLPVGSWDEFQRSFHLMGLQRNLKAWGRFVFILKVKHNPIYIEWVPQTMQQVKRFRAHYPEISAELERLSPEYRGA